MAYITVSEIKQYLGISNDDDDALLSSTVGRAQEAIDSFCNRTFEASANSTRYFDVNEDTDGRMLYLDEDLAEINSITTNADGTADVLSSSDYVTMPRNRIPYFAIKLLLSSDYIWTYTDDSEAGIEVSGKWAWSTTAPADISQACVRLTAYYYRQKDAQIFEVTAIPDAGVITAPPGLPADVRNILVEGGYRRL